ncbi:pyridoxamine 5'-phosphate oxidase family protein [Microlunatus sp. Gsoil 973]|uniref:pyridoxamine 5'-phosphate oxidase family protein n=1 Tax=Microlunatus sp. Gsoil 973 TaxID=2672569 RepID=UPI0012B44A49|nr:pyridoxamine 5'-phosphate oxidase family protein [Microlunatus sp. Gsoil 973]QGN31835.1 hypothetical protein GJV80_02280 [Microlunatus sp. Gsoil 973]
MTAHSDIMIPLDAGQCRAFLAAGSTGRVGWSSPSGHVVAPVHYIFLDPVIDLQPVPHDALADLARPTQVAFQVDNLDCDGGEALIVLIRGRSHPAAQPQPSAVADDGNPFVDVGWFPIEIEIDAITGHLIIKELGLPPLAVHSPMIMPGR